MINATVMHPTINSSAINGGDDLSALIDPFFAVFIPILCIAIVVGNLATIVAFWKVPSLPEMPSELLTLSLSFADLTTGLVVLPLFSPIYITPESWPFGELICRILIFFMDLSMHASLFTLCAISLDRFLLVLKEYPQYIRIQSLARIQAIIVIGWTFSMVTAVVEISIWEVAKQLDETASLIDFRTHCLSPPRRINVFALTFFLTLYLMPVIFVCGLSTSFFCLLRQRLKLSWSMRAESQLLSLSDMTPPSIPSPSSSALTLPPPPPTSSSMQRRLARLALRNLQRKRYIKPAVTLLALVTAMALCMLPYCFYVIAVQVFCPQCSSWQVLYILLLLQFCNACIDPFIYAMTQKKIQRFYKSYLRTHKKDKHVCQLS